MIDDDDFDFDQPVTRIPQNQNAQKQLGMNILREAEQYLEEISEDEHLYLIKTLENLASEESYFDVLANELNKPVEVKVANDALNLVYFLQIIHTIDDLSTFNFLDIINGEHFQKTFFEAFDELDIGDLKAQRRQVIEEAFKLYELKLYSGCVPLLYAQLEGLLTDILVQKGYLKQQETKYVDVYKIVSGLKGHEIKSLWHKAKIANELNHFFLELAAYKMDSSSTVSMTRHNILHGTDVSHFTQGRCFILFIWLFSAVSFMRSLK